MGPADLSLSFPIYDSNVPGQILSPVIINSYSALQIPAYWRAVNFLSANLASFPREVHDDGSPRVRKHPVDVLLKRRPNPYQTATVFWRQWFFDAVNEGNGYSWIQRTAGRPTGLLNMRPDQVTPFRYGGAQWYFYAVTRTVLRGDDVLHLPGLGYDGMIGYNPVFLLRETFQRARDLDQYRSRYLRRGTVMRGSIEIPATATKEQAEAIVAELKNYFAGPQAERDMLILSGGATLKNTTTTPEASQLMDQTRFSVKEISQITGVPPVYLYEAGDAKYNNSVEQAGIDVVRYTFRPWLDLVRDELTTKLLTTKEQDGGREIKLDPHDLLRGDTVSQTSVQVARVNAGISTPNDAREALDMADSDDPTADQLRALGSTAPAAADPAPAKGEGEGEGAGGGAAGDRVQSSRPAAAAAQTFAALLPILRGASGRVDAKSTHAFDRKGGTPKPELTIWANVFAEEQQRYAREALAPAAAALKQLTGDELDVERVANRYAAALRKRAADGTVTTLTAILEEEMNHEGDQGQRQQQRAAA